MSDTPHLDALGYLNQQGGRRATPKYDIVPRPIEKEEKRKAKAQREADFRKAVWLRDRNRSRASGKPLGRSGADVHRIGEVHHVIPRSLAPERIFDVANGLLLSRFEHSLTETACPGDPAHHFLDISGPDDRGQPQKFIWRDQTGTITKERIG